jgi:hypothetical protein
VLVIGPIVICGGGKGGAVTTTAKPFQAEPE